LALVCSLSQFANKISRFFSKCCPQATISCGAAVRETIGISSFPQPVAKVPKKSNKMCEIVYPEHDFLLNLRYDSAQ
jgi:hypothetical protein